MSSQLLKMVNTNNKKIYAIDGLSLVNSIKGIDADLYLLPSDVFGGENKENQCFNDDSYKADHGLQNISPCQFGKLMSKHLTTISFNKTILCSLRCASVYLKPTLLSIGP